MSIYDFYILKVSSALPCFGAKTRAVRSVRPYTYPSFESRPLLFTHYRPFTDLFDEKVKIA